MKTTKRAATADKSVKVACKAGSISRLTNLEIKFKALFGTASRLYLGVLKVSVKNFTLASHSLLGCVLAEPLDVHGSRNLVQV